MINNNNDEMRRRFLNQMNLEAKHLSVCVCVCVCVCFSPLTVAQLEVKVHQTLESLQLQRGEGPPGEEQLLNREVSSAPVLSGRQVGSSVSLTFACLIMMKQDFKTLKLEFSVLQSDLHDLTRPRPRGGGAGPGEEGPAGQRGHQPVHDGVRVLGQDRPAGPGPEAQAQQQHQVRGDTDVYVIQMFMRYRCVIYTDVYVIQMFMRYRCVIYTDVYEIQMFM